MKRKLPWVLLAISLGFNVCFAVGFLRAGRERHRPRTFRERTRAIARRLELDEQQLRVFDELADQYEQLRNDRAPQREAFWAEMTRDQPDRKLLAEHVSGEEATRNRLAKLDLMLKTIALLRPQQREKLLQMIKRPDAPSK